MKTYTDCKLCAGSGNVRVAGRHGFFDYKAGDECPDCSGRDWMEKNPYNVRAGVSDLEDRVRRLEEAVFGTAARNT